MPHNGRDAVIEIKQKFKTKAKKTHFFCQVKIKKYIQVADPWRCSMTFRVKRDKIMGLSDWSVLLLIGRTVWFRPPDPFVARMFFSRSVLTAVKSSFLGRKTELLLQTKL